MGRPISELAIPEGTHDPDAFRDSRRLAYRAEVPVNWCPELGTVLANEEVIDGKSERGGYPVVRMPLTQWMLRITSYAERLVDDLEDLDWPRPIKEMQRNWVGRSEGAEVDFPIAGPDPEFRQSIRVFTTRPDTLFGATYMVLAPEHPLVDRITTDPQSRQVESYRETASHKSDLDRTDLAKTKTGVATGAFAINPVNGREIPIWIADYVLMGYGTGAIMAVPGHDDRDFEFAQAFRLPILRVVAKSGEQAEEPLTRGRGRIRGRRQLAKRLDHARRPVHRRGQGRHHRMARGAGPGQEDHQLQAARLAVFPPTLLGRAFPRRAGRARSGASALRDGTAGPPARARRLQADGQAGTAAEQGEGMGPLLGQGPTRDQHDAPVGRLVLVLPALYRP